MAIYSFQCNIVARGQRLNNAVAHSAYINRIDDKNVKDGTSWRYAQKADDIAFSNVLLPSGASNDFKNPSYLWNAVEQKENRSNSRLARAFIIALPNELTLEQNKELVENFIKENFTKVGMIANYAIHKDKEDNIHCHIMTTTRELDPSGNQFAKNNVLGREWNNKDNMEKWRLAWEDNTNAYLKKYNHKSRIDRRTLNDQLLEATEDFEKNPTAENYKRVFLLDRPAFKRVSQKSLKEEQSKRIKIKKQIEIKSEKECKRFKDILNAHESIIIENRNPDPVVRRPRQKKQNNEIIPLVPFSAVNTENTSEPKKTKEYVYKIPFKERLRSRLVYLANKRKVQKQNKEIENKIKKGEFWNAAVFTDSQKMANTDHLASKEYKSYKDTLKDNFANRLFEKGNFSGSRKDYDVSLTKDHKLVVRPRVKGDYSIK
ncbi:MobA/MobL family protein [Enterobacter roggenkampii]|uniref:MobA/MobL family protein n=1 Tax=Enterobacter roggenkampii TaxID=1812935 RepID=UPI0032B0140F